MVRGSIHHDYIVDDDIVQIHQVNAEKPDGFGASLRPRRRDSLLIAVDREVTEGYIHSSRWRWWPRIGWCGRVWRTVVDSVIIGSILDKKSGTAAQSRDRPVSARREEQA